jgi:hypothetical protein
MTIKKRIIKIQFSWFLMKLFFIIGVMHGLITHVTMDIFMVEYKMELGYPEIFYVLSLFGLDGCAIGCGSISLYNLFSKSNNGIVIEVDDVQKENKVEQFSPWND